MGFGFRCGFLGMLHMEIVQERLEREYNLDLISTAPTVVYEVLKTDGSIINMDNPAKLPPVNQVEEIREPIIRANVLTPRYIGNIIKLCEEKRGSQIGINYLGSQVQISYELPMAEVVLDFFDKLKSVSRGYASLDYHFVRFDAGPFVRVDVLINGDKVDALSLIVHRSHADRRGRELCEKMKDLIRARCSTWPSRLPSARRSSPAPRSRPCARTCWPSAMVATFRARRSFWKSRRKARSA